MTEVRFLPAYGHSMWRSCQRAAVPTCIDAARRGTVVYYPHGLLSYHYWKKIKLSTEWRDAGFMFGDSGGFSIRTEGAVIDAARVLRWQAAVCTAGCLLDVPTKDQYERPCWAVGLAKTCAHTAHVLPLYEKLLRADTAFRWWGVLHGNFGPQLVGWWNKISAIYPFSEQGEGWAVRPEPTITHYTLAHMLQFLKQRRVRRAHFLAATAIKSAATIAVLSEEVGLEFASFDSASAAIASGNRQIMVPTADGVAWTLLKEKTRTGKTHDDQWRMREYLWNHCACGFCAELRGCYPTIALVTDMAWVVYSFLHNLFIQIRTFNAHGAAIAAGDGHALLRTLLGHEDYFKVMRAFAGKLGQAADAGAPRSLLDFL